MQAADRQIERGDLQIGRMDALFKRAEAVACDLSHPVESAQDLVLRLLKRVPVDSQELSRVLTDKQDVIP